MKWPWGIAFRFTMAMNLVVLLAIILLSTLYYYSESRKLEETLREEGIAIAGTLGSAIGSSMLKKEYEAISPLAYAIISRPTVQYVTVRDVSGRIIQQKGETESGKSLLVENVPLLYFQKKVGEIEIAMKTDRLMQQRTSLLSSTVTVAILLSMLSFFVSIIISRLLTSPLKHLLKAVQMKGSGIRHLHVEEKGPVEIAELSKAFNEMVRKIDHYEETLEGEIRKATERLREKVKRLEEVEERLRQSAFHDYLTGLPNYRALREDLVRILKGCEKELCDGRLAILFLDLDRFKIINDTLGHEFGDLILKKVSAKLKEVIGNDGRVYRMGGDEFILSFLDIDGFHAIREKAKDILSVFQQPWIVGEYEIPMSASIGIAIYPQDGEEAEELIRNADTAMYRVKSQGKRGFSFYTPSPEDPTYERILLEKDLLKGIDQGEFQVYYQPKIELATGRLSGLEALVRWNHPRKGILEPKVFIPLAEETGLILPLGEHILRQACIQGVKWLDKGYDPILISVNLSTRQFMQTNLAGFIEETLKETGFPPSSLELEITESMMADVDRGEEILFELKRIGVRISIDDFGTGYSSLYYLQNLPIDALKIDRSFLEDIPNNRKHEAIVMTIISMAKNLSLGVTAEGVEREEQVAFLKEHQCNELQGYYVSEPLPAGELEERFLKMR